MDHEGYSQSAGHVKESTAGRGEQDRRGVEGRGAEDGLGVGETENGTGAERIESLEGGMEDMVLEEGKLEDTALNLDPQYTQSYYTLNAIEPVDTSRRPSDPVGAGGAGTHSGHLTPDSLMLTGLQHRHSVDTQHHNIRFSPEGNEGLLLTTCHADLQENRNTPREVDEHFLQRYNYPSHQETNLSRQTGIQSVSTNQAAAHSVSTKQAAAHSVSTNQASAHSVPTKQHPGASKGTISAMQNKVSADLRFVTNSVRMTPRDLIPSDLQCDEFSGDSGTSPRSAGCLTDRATSPSAASVTSLQSVSSQASVTGRRLLEWDYGSDIGYMDGQLTQVQAAQSLSTLEKLAIGNYSDILRDSNHQDSALRRTSRENRLPLEGENMDADAKMKMFAQSLIRQRELRQNETRSRRKSSSPKRTSSVKEVSQNYDSRAVNVPVIKAVSSSTDQQLVSSPEKPKSKTKMLRRSSSLSELQLLSETGLTAADSQVSRSASNNYVGLGANLSNSSNDFSPNVDEDGLRTHNSEQRPFSQYLESVNIELSLNSGNMGPQLSQLRKTSRQSSKRSMSTSFETVIAADPTASSGRESFDTEDENRPAASQVQRQGVLQDWSKAGGRGQFADTGHTSGERVQDGDLDLDLDRVQQVQRLAVQQAASSSISHSSRNMSTLQTSGNSSLPSTSDEDTGRRRVVNSMVRSLDQRETGGDTSTLDSVQMIDRAKSFEYIPGESFPIQENSSSYEYLPGHLVPEQRPPTALNLAHGEENQSLREASRTRSESVPSSRSYGNPTSVPTEILQDPSLDQLARDLKGKSQELYARNVSMTKHFYKKLRRYLDFLSTPSNTVAECRIKQQLAVKISNMLTSEQSRLQNNSEISSRQEEVTSVSELHNSSTSGSLDSPPVKPNYSSDKKMSGSSPASKTSRNNGSSPAMSLTKSNSESPGYGADKLKLVLDSDLSPNTMDRKDWKTGKTKSEERFERKMAESTNDSIKSVESINIRRAEHLRILRRELKILERLEREGKKENLAASSSKSHSTSRGKSSYSSGRLTTTSPTRKLTHSKRSRGVEDVSKVDDATRTRDSTTITDFMLSKDASDKKDELKTLTESEGHSYEDAWRKKEGRRKEKGKLVDRGTQMTESDVSSVLNPSEGEVRRSKKVNKRSRSQKESRRHSTRTESVRIHANVEVQSTEESLQGVPSPRHHHPAVASPSHPDDGVLCPPGDSTVPCPPGGDEGAHVSTPHQHEARTPAHHPRHTAVTNRRRTPSPRHHRDLPPPSTHHQQSPFSPPRPTFCTSETSFVNHRRETRTLERGETETTSTVCSSVDTTEEIFIRRTRHWNKENLPAKKSKDNRQQRKSSKKPVAYFLPMDNLSPIRIGKKILKDSLPNQQGFHSFKHRDILTKYISSVDSAALIPGKVVVQSRPPPLQAEQGCAHNKLSLQQALITKHPHFVHRCEHRMQILRQIRQDRKLREDRQDAWLQHIRDLSPNSRKNAQPCFSPVAAAPRLFSHREMVTATRSRYRDLPEVVRQKHASRQQVRYATNRLRAEVYSRQLKRRIKTGQVSLTHHTRVF